MTFMSVVRHMVPVAILFIVRAEAAPPIPATPAPPPSSQPPANATEEWSAARHDACLKALGGHLSRSPYLAEVRASPIDKTHLPYSGWNINSPYQAGAINLLVPDGEITMLPPECGSAPSFPTCWSYPSSGSVLCNPAMGKHLAAPENNPPFDAYIMVAFRFVFFLALGHELGHLELDRTAARAALRPPPLGNLTCFPLPQSRGTLEARCDDIGIRLGCAWLKNSKVPSPLAVGNPREDLKLLAALQSIADLYHKGDELCLGDLRYDPIAARIQRFGAGILECFGLGDDSPVLRLARQEAKAFTAADDNLRKRQLAGWPASSLYGRARIIQQRLLGAHRGPLFLNWIDTGVASAFQVVRAVDGEGVQFSGHLVGWKPAARLVSLATTVDGWRALIDVEAAPGQRKLEDVEIRCTGDLPEQCARTPATETAWRGEGVVISDGGGIVVWRDSEVRIYASRKALSDGSMSGGQSRFSPGSRFELVSPLPGGGALAMTFRRDGLFIADVFENNQQRVVSLPFPIQGHMRLAAMHVDARHLLAFFERDNLGAWEAHSLWDCPPALLTSKKGSKLTCRSFELPPAMADPLVLATRTEDAIEPSRIERIADTPDQFALSTGGWTWLIDLAAEKELLLPAQGVARIETSRIYSYRAGRLDAVRADWHAVASQPRSVVVE